jgi:hypothetical protein
MSSPALTAEQYHAAMAAIMAAGAASIHIASQQAAIGVVTGKDSEPPADEN